MIGRKVSFRGAVYRVACWEPFGHAMCDVLLEAGGEPFWAASHECRPADGLGPLPSRQEAVRQARAESLAQLRGIRAHLIEDLARPWPGAEFGKGIIGMALDRAIREIEEEMA